MCRAMSGMLGLAMLGVLTAGRTCSFAGVVRVRWGWVCAGSRA